MRTVAKAALVAVIAITACETGTITGAAEAGPRTPAPPSIPRDSGQIPPGLDATPGPVDTGPPDAGPPGVCGHGGEACCTTGTVCIAPLMCLSGTCAMCGELNAVCCSGACNAGLSCTDAGVCASTGGGACGGDFQPCCDGGLCNADAGLACMVAVCRAAGMCGGSGESCCADRTCDPGLMCAAGHCE